MAQITDKNGAAFQLLNTGTKYSWGYLVTRNGKSTGGGGVNLFIGSDGLAHVVNSQGNEYVYSGGWQVYKGKSIPTANTQAGAATVSSGLQQASPSPSGTSIPLVGTKPKSILDQVSFSVEGGKKSQTFLLAGLGIAAVVAVVYLITRKKRKK